MAAEIYQYDLWDGVPDIVKGQLVRDSQTYWDTGYGDGLGHETLVTVHSSRVQVLIGKVTVELLEDGGQSVTISEANHIATLEPGETHTQELIGPVDNNPARLHVRNIDDSPVYPTSYHTLHGRLISVSSN